MNMIEFAKDWEACWNGHDLDRIMAHDTEDIVFRSRKAVPLVGAAEIRGKDRSSDLLAEGSGTTA